MMMMFSKKEYIDPVRDKAEKRLSKIRSNEVLDWTDACAGAVFRALDDYRKLSDMDSLLQAKQGVSAVQAALDVLIRRQELISTGD